MANTSIPLIALGTNLSSSNNSFVTGWGDKRSGNSAGVSIVFYGTNNPDGYAWLEISNAVSQPGNAYLPPNYGVSNNPASTATYGDDATELSGSQQNITLNPITGLYTAMWQETNLPARWIRLRYTATESVSGLSVNVYLNVPHESP